MNEIQESETASARLTDMPTGLALLHDPSLNKGTAFTEIERESLGLRGLLPPFVMDQGTQAQRAMENLRRKNSDLERYIYLISLQDRNEALFYRVVMDNIQDIMPLIYTPTVGEACQQFGHIFRRPRGLFISIDDVGRVEEVLRNWPYRAVSTIVVTDGERILGLGDLGADGMGIPIGKLVLYTVCAGLPPAQCLPVMLDVGTDNEDLLNDPLYIGLRRRRVRGAQYDKLIEEFLDAVTRLFPTALVQLEDFANTNAFRLLGHYRGRMPLFDDDIQGTGGVVLAGVYSAMRISGTDLQNQRFLFVGAGEAGIGIADMLVAALETEGMNASEARERCWFMDSRGLVVADRTELQPYKRVYAHCHQKIDTLVDAIYQLRPNVLIGVCGKQGIFNREALAAMAEYNERPIILALSNPTSRSECTAQQAYSWTKGRAIFASGSPFGSVDHGSVRFTPGQANNAYIFPGVGLGVLTCAARLVTDEMFFAAAKALAKEVSDDDLVAGSLYPPLSRIREVSARIAEAVAEVAFERGLAGIERPVHLSELIRSSMYQPDYPSYAPTE